MKIIHKKIKIILLNINNKLKICKTELNKNKIEFLSVNFSSGINNFRRKYNRQKELIIQAIKIKKKKIVVLDATAGLGKDSFILASYGYKVFMIEKNKIIYHLLKNGLERAYQDINLNKWIKKKMILFYGNSLNFIQSKKIFPDVIYLDPMFLNKKKSFSKKDMFILKIILKKDQQTPNLLKQSLKFSRKKVVVKRPLKSPYLENIKPTYAIFGKKYRFDIYIINH
jgi:16S rRNA (guanine1516-N2)-methyltransferase